MYAALQTRNTQGLRGCDCIPPRFSLGALGDASGTLTAEQALQQAIAESSDLKLNPRDFRNSGWLSKAAEQVAAGRFDVAWYSPSCTGQEAPTLNAFQTDAGLALGTTSAGVGILGMTHVIAAAAIPVIGVVIAGVGVLIGLIGQIFAHHAAAVKRDLTFGCSALPAVNNAFSVIEQAVQNGQTTPDAAAAALDEIYSRFESAGGAAINDSPWCNSNCEMGVILKGMILYWKSQYAAMAAAAPGSGAMADLSAAASSVGGWIPLAIVGGLVLWGISGL